MSLASKLLCGVALAALTAVAAIAQEGTVAPETGTEAAPDTTEAPDATGGADAAETPAPPSDVDADTVVASVNGTDITLGHMIVARARLPEQYQSLPDETLFSGILDQLIQQIAVGGDDGELSKGSALALENERRSFLAGEALTEVADTAVTDEAIQTLYDERYADAEPVTEYNAAHILVETEEEAKAIKAEIDGGAEFAAVAEQQSTGPSGPNGGDLGWFSAGMMVEPFEQAVMGMEAGQVSDPVQTQFGWHVIRLNETRIKAAPPLDEVRGELEGELQQQAIEKTVTDAVAAAEVTRPGEGIDPTVLRNLDLVAE